MNILKIPTLEFYEFKSSVSLADHTLNDVISSTIKIDPVNLYGYTKSKTYYYDPLYLWINQCLEQIKLLFKDDESLFDLCISDCWVNRQRLGEKVGEHYHSMSLISGIYYLDDSDTKTVFQIQNNNFPSPDFFFNGYSKSKIKYEVKPEKGKLILFPSYIRHSVNMHRSLTTRYTVAFNTFYKGIVSKRSTALLEINTTDIKERAMRDV
jgi:uncharacterized protein (TIGR02466 family)